MPGFLARQKRDGATELEPLYSDSSSYINSEAASAPVDGSSVPISLTVD